MQTSGQVAKLGQRQTELVGRLADQLLDPGLRSRGGMREAEQQRGVDKSLLRTVVEVALDAPALPVLGADEAVTGGSNLSISLKRWKTSPACDAMSDRRRRSTGFNCSPGGLTTISAPSSSSPWKTGTTRRELEASEGGSISPTSAHAPRPLSGGHDAAKRSRSPTRTHTSLRTAEVPSDMSCAIRARMASDGSAWPTWRAKSESTSYGLARRPYTSRLARSWRRVRTGSNAIATIAIARTVRAGSKPARFPSMEPSPSTMAT